MYERRTCRVVGVTAEDARGEGKKHPALNVSLRYLSESYILQLYFILN